MKIAYQKLENAAGTKEIGEDYLIDGVAKAWSLYDGTGTISLYDSFNVTSLTDIGTGVYENNLTSAMDNANFASSANGHNYHQIHNMNSATTSICRQEAYNSSHGAADTNYMAMTVLGDLA